MDYFAEGVGVDWDEVHRAKRKLIQLIWGDPNSDLWYLVELVNRLQELAVHESRWSFPIKEEGMRKSELSGPDSPEDGDLCWDYNRAVGMEWRNGGWQDVPYYFWAEKHREVKP